MVNRSIALLVCLALSGPAVAGGYGGHYHYGYRHHGSGDEGATLLAGLVVGGLIGYLLSEDRYDRRYYQTWHRAPSYRRAYYHYDPPPVVYRETVVVHERAWRARVREPAFKGHNCRMTREYTTTLDIDGVRREAFGRRCLTAAGAWVLGPPELVPQFD